MVNKMTFKEFLMEVDVGDLQLQQQASQQQQQAAGEQQARDAFKTKMGSSTPNKGDVIQTKHGKFVVLGGSMDGIQVKQLGGDKTATIPHGTKFNNEGQGQSGKTVFSVVQ